MAPAGRGSVCRASRVRTSRACRAAGALADDAARPPWPASTGPTGPGPRSRSCASGTAVAPFGAAGAAVAEGDLRPTGADEVLEVAPGADPGDADGLGCLGRRQGAVGGPQCVGDDGHGLG